MNKLNCYLEENAFVAYLDDISANMVAIENFISTMESVDGAQVCNLYIPSNFYEIRTPDGEPTCQKIFALSADRNTRDALLRLGAIIDKAKTYPDVNNAPLRGLRQLEMRQAGGLISESADKFDWWNDNQMYAICTPSDLKFALRKHYVNELIDEKYFPSFCTHMFDNLYFSHQANTFGSLGVNYITHIKTFINHLSYLNDDVTEHFSIATTNLEKINRAAAFGVEISPESPLTRNNARAMRERYITISDQSICCEWHTKIEPQRGRIHFNAQPNRPKNITSIVGEKVIVGIFATHLLT
ncbi:MAG: hypothetical protein Q7K13_07680 [Polynucleobacter sp.]|uniref:hypothetical protein n=1 Tax=Polynucleobacter sp. TaxID=2029855 RepID=UPI002723D832|nr:hypothetical protein [Polynucleobacter sp.]MDO8714341.1 hypothetical protein [Polynucleobacter sp.]